jgi:hypothetical protein
MNYYGYNVELFSAQLIVAVNPAKPLSIPYNYKALFDAYEVENTIIIDPSRNTYPNDGATTYYDTHGRISVSPKNFLRWGGDGVFAIEYSSDVSLKMGISIYSKGREFHKEYFYSSPREDNLILIRRSDFDLPVDYSSIEKIDLYIYTAEQKSIGKLSLGRLLYFDNENELRYYFSEHGIPISINATLNAYAKGKEIIVNKKCRDINCSSNSYLSYQGRLTLNLIYPQKWSGNELLGIAFSNDGLLALGVGIYSDGQEYFRYYPNMLAGEDNLILLSRLGFNAGEEIHNIEKIVVYFYTVNQSSVVTVKNPYVYLFDNAILLHKYFFPERHSNFQFYVE